jgi:hypothetical protein
MQEVESPSLSSVTSVRSRSVSDTITLAPIRLAETASCTTGTPEFEADISHRENSSSQVSACSVELEPSTPHYVGLIVRKPRPNYLKLTQPVLSGSGTPQLYEFADPYAVCSQRLLPRYQPRLLVYLGCPHLNDLIRGHSDKYGL